MHTDSISSICYCIQVQILLRPDKNDNSFLALKFYAKYKYLAHIENNQNRTQSQ